MKKKGATPVLKQSKYAAAVSSASPAALICSLASQSHLQIEAIGKYFSFQKIHIDFETGR